jgi:hypothetical protein|tara:strand:- start:340 stop:762 length:423 start_codon:yes stop_codon:yes gene_type:complete
MRFEKQTDLQREMKAIKLFTDGFKGGFIKLGQNDIDFTILDANHTVIAYAEVKGRNKTMQDAFPLPIAARKIVKLMDKSKTVEPIVIWACLDGIIYGRIKKLGGVLKVGGRKPREHAANDIEAMVYYYETADFKKINYLK